MSSKECIFACRYDSELKKDRFYKGFFKNKEVSEEEFFGAQRERLKETGFYKLLPILENERLDTITYLYKKAELSRKNNWESDFGKRVKVKAKFVEDDYYKEVHEKNLSPDCLRLNVWIFDEKTGVNEFGDNKFTIRVWYSVDNYEYWNYSAELIALLIRNALNGNLQTARDIAETEEKRTLDIYLEEGWNFFTCEECNEKFSSLNDFFCHLIEEGHYDSFLDEFPNDRETLHVKEMINKKVLNKEE